MSVQLGKIGVWSTELRFGDQGMAREAIAELDALGYGAAWTPGGVGGDILDTMNRLLAAAPRIAVASGIFNVWKHEAKEAGDWWRALSPAHQKRAMLGIGISHAPLIGDAYVKPLAKMQSYLDELDAAGMPRDHMCIGALAPKMLALAGQRTAGAHPFFVTPEHTARARAIMGPGALLAPEQKVILERDPAKAREIARKSFTHYLRLPNYVRNWMSLGFAEDELTQMTDRVVDALVAWGGPDEIKVRVDSHYAAGADHVCIQVLGVDAAGLPKVWRELAGALAAG